MSEQGGKGERVQEGKIVVNGPLSVSGRILRLYKLGDGEIESVRLFQESRDHVEYLVIDDNLAYIVSDRMGLSKIFFLDLILEIVKRNRLDGATARKIIEMVRPRFSEGFIEHSLEILKRQEEGRVEREYQRKLRELYDEYQRGEISLGYLAKEMGVGRREVEDILEKQGLKVSNI